MTKIICLSDTHSYIGRSPLFPEIPDCDLLLLAGDYTFEKYYDWKSELKFINKYFKPWLRSIQDRGITIAGCLGNHDCIWESHTELVLDLLDIFTIHGPKEFLGYKCFFSSYTITFYDWAFNLDEPNLAKKWLDIPDNTEILVCHQPPYGFGDLASRDRVLTHVGSPSLSRRIFDLPNLRLVLSGHLHENKNYGIREVGNTKIVNACYVREDYSVRPDNLISIEI